MTTNGNNTNNPPPPPPPGNNQNAANNDVQTALIQRVGLKIPPFWEVSPEIWFAQIEAQFTTAQVTTDISKFNAIVGAIESKILTEVTDAVLQPPQADKYKNLKKRILEEFSDSSHKKMTKLLQDIALGDQKPSSLLNEMRRLSTPDMTDDLLKTLWLKRLPTQAKVILSTNNADLPELAIADKIVEIGNLNSVHEVSSSRSADNSLEKCIAQLTKAVEALSFRNGDSHNSRSMNRSRSRSQSKSRGRPENRNTNPAAKEFDMCWYHFKFGHKAKKCPDPNPPCSFGKSKN